jgi:hypothetical protein
MDPNDPAMKAKHAAIAGSAKHGKQVCIVISLADADTASCRNWSGVLAKSQKASASAARVKAIE